MGSGTTRKGRRLITSCADRCWISRTLLERRLIILSIVLLIFLFLIIIAYLIFNGRVRICTSPKCVRTATVLLNHIDVRADPCEDFYRFSCGNFLKNTKLDDRAIRSVHTVAEEEIDFEIKDMLEQPIQFDNPAALKLAKKFYRACMNESAIEAEGLRIVKQIFRQIGGWPTLDGSNWSEIQFDWKYSVNKLRRIGINLSLFLNLDLEEDKTNRSRYILTLSNPACDTPSEIEVNMRNLYLDYMEELSTLFGAERSHARRDSEDVLNFYLKLGKISEEAEGMNETEMFLSPTQLKSKYPSIHWFDFINEFLKPTTAITYDDVIKVSQPHYFEKLEVLLHETRKRTVANSICWYLVQKFTDYFPAEIYNKAYEFSSRIKGFAPREPRWSTCISIVQEKLTSVIAEAYIQAYFDEETNSKVLEMCHKIKKQFRGTLDNLDWMDEHTRQFARQKLLSSVEETVSPQLLLRIAEGNAVYAEVEVNENEFLKSALNLDLINTNLKFEQLRETVRDNWLRHSEFLTGSDIIYSPRSNSLRFPIGVMRTPYFNKDRPGYMNYGSLGSIIGHKISHIFTEAQYYGESGTQIRSWWTPQTLLNYEEKLQCLSNQYNEFVVGEIGKHVNGSGTRYENIAELAGKKVAYDTYINWLHENGPEDLLPGLNYSPNQLFWISSSIHHCSKYSTDMLEQYIANRYKSPSQFRVNGVLQNIPEFASDFGCEIGRKMNPARKCNVW